MFGRLSLLFLPRVIYHSRFPVQLERFTVPVGWMDGWMLERVGTFGQQMKPLGRNNGAHFLITGIFLGAARCSLYKKSTKLPGAAFDAIDPSCRLTAACATSIFRPFPTSFSSLFKTRIFGGIRGVT
jgi:hypothetical protein